MYTSTSIIEAFLTDEQEQSYIDLARRKDDDILAGICRIFLANVANKVSDICDSADDSFSTDCFNDIARLAVYLRELQRKIQSKDLKKEDGKA